MNKSTTINFAFNILLLLLIFSSIFAYAMFQGGFVSWFLFYSTVVILLLEFVVVFFPFRNLDVKREINKHSFRNKEKVIVTITITKSRYVPFFYLVVNDGIPELCKDEGFYYNRDKLFYFSFSNQLSYSYEIDQLPRGEYIFDHIEIKTGDLFGLFSKVKNFKVINKVLIFPDYQDVTNWQILDAEESLLSSKLASGSDITSLSGLREYIQGDRLYSIHWKATARSNKLMTKEFESYEEQTYFILLDCSISKTSYKVKDLFEKSIQFTASIVRYSIQSKIMVGLTTAGKNITRLPPNCSDDHQMTILRQLAKIEHTTKSSFTDAFNDLLSTTTPGATMFIVNTKISQSILDLIKKAEVKNITVIYFLLANEQYMGEKDRNLLAELRKLTTVLYVIKSKDFNHDLKAGEEHGR